MAGAKRIQPNVCLYITDCTCYTQIAASLLNSYLNDTEKFHTNGQYTALTEAIETQH
jgi:hypothetical protein